MCSFFHEFKNKKQGAEGSLVTSNFKLFFASGRSPRAILKNRPTEAYRPYGIGPPGPIIKDPTAPRQ